MTPHDIAEFINTIGLPLAALLFVTAAFLTRKVVTREELASLQSRCDRLEAELQATREDLRRSNELLARVMEQAIISQEP